MGFGQEEVSTSRGSRFRLECKWQAESRLCGVGVRGQKRSTQAAMGRASHFLPIWATSTPRWGYAPRKAGKWGASLLNPPVAESSLTWSLLELSGWWGDALKGQRLQGQEKSSRAKVGTGVVRGGFFFLRRQEERAFWE